MRGGTIDLDVLTPDDSVGLDHRSGFSRGRVVVHAGNAIVVARTGAGIGRRLFAVAGKIDCRTVS